MLPGASDDLPIAPAASSLPGYERMGLTQALPPSPHHPVPTTECHKARTKEDIGKEQLNAGI